MNDARRPLVSVCIANYDGAAIVGACIESVLSQACDADVELIVHDDASTDDSRAVIGGFPGVRAIFSSPNAGFCVSNNRMAAAARGDFLLLLNNDATLMPGALQALLRRSAELCHDAVLGLPQYDARNGELIDRGCWLDWLMCPVPRREAGAPAPAMVIGACMWIPRAIWERVGGFPEFFVTNAEDVYLCLAARWLGHGVGTAETTGFLHLLGATQGGGKAGDDGRLRVNRRRRYRSERNRALVLCIFCPRLVLPFALAAHWAVLALEALAIGLSSRDAALVREVYLDSQRDALRHLGDASRLRARLLGVRGRKSGGPGPFGRIVLVPAKLRLLFRYGLPAS